jgi:hypothetical protein
VTTHLYVITSPARPAVRAAVWSKGRAALLSLLGVSTLAASDGGYWPTAWGWTAIAFCWLAALALVFQGRHELGRLEVAVLAALAGLLAWILLSVLWTSSAGRSMLEAERTAAYGAGLLAALVFTGSRSYRALLGGIWVAVWLVSAYALATRLFPERLGVFDPIAEYRLSEPLGYWNALAIFAAFGVLLALGLAAHAPGPVLPSLAAASLLTLLPTLYFTFSRGGWIALGVGLCGAVAIDPDRLRLITAALVLTPTAALGIAVAYSADALTRTTASVEAASRDGHRLALVLVGLAVANVLVVLALRLLDSCITIPRAAQRAFVAVLCVVLAASLAATFARYGDPAAIARRAYHSFVASPPPSDEDLNRRLFTLSSNGRVETWKAAWAASEDHRWLGSGAGSYEQYWLRHRTEPMKVVDAHSLYLETLAELGPLGLLLLLAALAPPIVAAIRARGEPLVPVALGAYVAYLTHAAVDWDWEMTAVTLTALLCGAALLVAARTGDVVVLSRNVRVALVAGVVAVAGFAFVGLVGNSVISSATKSADAGRWTEAEAKARRAMAWMPWSSDPWQTVGHAQLARQRIPEAQAALRSAIAKDTQDWELWANLARTSTGRMRTRAAMRAIALNPLAPELADLRRLVGGQNGPGATEASGQAE